MEMFHLYPQQLEGTVDTSRFVQVVNIHPGYLGCDANYTVDVVHRGRNHPILMINGRRDEKPFVYLDGARIVIIEGCGVRTVDLENECALDGVNTTCDIRRAIRFKDTILICHLYGCTAYSADLSEELWSLYDVGILDVVWQDDMLLAFRSEHSSVRVDPETGDMIPDDERKSILEEYEAENVIRLAAFSSKRR